MARTAGLLVSPCGLPAFVPWWSGAVVWEGKRGSCNTFKGLGLEITSIISADAPFERRSGIHRKSEVVAVHDHVCIYLTSIIEKKLFYMQIHE